MIDYKEKYDNIIDIVAIMREALSKVDPDYVDEHLGEMVGCPEACAELIAKWLLLSEELVK